jgi:adenylate cyclase
MEMDRIKTRFFANISHEFRTPLTLIIGPLEDCLAGSAKPPLSQLEMMLRNCRRLLRLINQLLDIAKLEADGMKLAIKHGNLTPFLDGIVRSFTPSAERSGIDLQAGADDGDVKFCFDAEKLEQVFSNLLSNALKFTPRGGKVHVRSAVVANPPGEESVKITVKDTGHGIPKQELPYIFDRFRQVDGSSTRAHDGTGIGLALVKDLVALHGGRIDVVSEPGFGTEFTVTLPYRLGTPAGAERETDDEEMATELETLSDNLKSEIAGLEQHYLIQHSDDAVPSTQQCVEAQADKGTILVIDDNPDIRSYLVDCLTPRYAVIQAKDGVDGLRLAQDTRPDLILCDIMMPRIDGYDVCRALKADQRLDHIPLVFLTAKASSAMKVEGLKTGADDYIAKPFNARELLARVGNLITMRRQERELKTLNECLEEKVKQQLETILKGKRLTRYFSRKLLDRILANDETPALTSERRKITVFFSDLCNFTDLVDSAQPEEVGRILNEYLSEMTLLIAREGATLVQVIGDGIMVFFGAPDRMDSQDQASNAMKMALAMQRRMRQLSRKWLNEGLEQNVAVRMGIHQDYLTVGNFGCEEFMEYTAVGKGITLASRLESTCTPGNIKVSYPIYTLTKEHFPYDDLREEQFKGMARPLQVCELNPDRVVA